jgi:tetratricopeptide (TPR) repeat protein
MGLTLDPALFGGGGGVGRASEDPAGETNAAVCLVKGVEFTASAGRSEGYLDRIEHAAQAVQWLDRAAVLDPRNAAVWSTRGELLVSRHQFPEAIASFTKAVAIDPTNGEMSLLRWKAVWLSSGMLARATCACVLLIAANKTH